MYVAVLRVSRTDCQCAPTLVSPRVLKLPPSLVVRDRTVLARKRGDFVSEVGTAFLPGLRLLTKAVRSVLVLDEFM